MSVAICILAKDEGRSIGNTLGQLAQQTFLTNTSRAISIHVVANGCTDETVEMAMRESHRFDGTLVDFQVHDLHPGGKSRAWNQAVHRFIGTSVETLIFVDADVSFVDHGVISELVAALESDPKVAVCSGHPIKDLAAKRRKSPVDLFSLAVSKRTRHVGAINGSLYAARANCLRDIWLPDDTPGEDGFLNAMVTTKGFTTAPEAELVVSTAEPTHYFRAHGPREFLAHERRMIVGTVINCWIFEHLWSLGCRLPVGPSIRRWNEADPLWVERIIRERVSNRRWLIPTSVLLGRFRNVGAGSLLRNIIFLPMAAAATVLTLPPAIYANQRLKQVGAAKTW